MRNWLLVVAWCLNCVALAGEPDAVGKTTNPVRIQTLSGPPVTLVRDGKPQATIVIPKEVIQGPRGDKGLYALAAQEFADYVELATGARLPVVTDEESPEGALILIGEGRQAREASITAADLPLEGFRVRTFDRGVAIVGAVPNERQQWAIKFGGQKGILWGVYDVLERFAGVRWYYPGDDGQVVPRHKDLVIPACTYTDAPVRIKRQFYTYSVKGMPPGTDLSGFAWKVREGVSSPISTGCYTPDNFGIHFEAHPECFQLKADGTRDSVIACYGNPKTVELMIQDLENFYAKGDKRPWTRKNGQVWTPPTEWTIHISPPRSPVDCHCEFCKALIEPKAREIGRGSRLMVRFVDRMAREIAQRWPEKTVFYLAGGSHTLPPDEDVKLPSNVVAGICLLRGAANAKEPSIAADLDGMITGWHRITGNPVHLWEFICWPAEDTALPYQFPHVLKDFQKRYGSDIVVGSFINGGAGPKELPGQSFAFQHWSIYCWMRLMWNPDFDVDAALEEYLTLMYGPAREPMAGIYRLLIDRWEQTRWKQLPEVHRISMVNVHEETMPKAEAARLKALLAAAEKAAGENNVYRRRVDFVGNALKLFFAESDRYHSGEGLAELAVLKVNANPTIDGKLDEPCWNDAQKQRFRKAYADQSDPVAGTNASYVQAVWTAEGVTFGLIFEHPNPQEMVAEATVRDQANIWFEECAELFLDVEGQRDSFVHFITNPLGTLWDGKDDLKGLNAAVVRESNRWTIEFYVPIEDLKYKKNLVMPRPGAIWYGNIIRNSPSDGKPNYQRWSTLGRPSHSDFAAFGKLVFVE